MAQKSEQEVVTGKAETPSPLVPVTKPEKKGPTMPSISIPSVPLPDGQTMKQLGITFGATAVVVIVLCVVPSSRSFAVLSLIATAAVLGGGLALAFALQPLFHLVGLQGFYPWSEARTECGFQFGGAFNSRHKAHTTVIATEITAPTTSI